MKIEISNNILIFILLSLNLFFYVFCVILMSKLVDTTLTFNCKQVRLCQMNSVTSMAIVITELSVYRFFL